MQADWTPGIGSQATPDREPSKAARRIGNLIAYVCGAMLLAATLAVSAGIVGRRLFAYSIPWAVDAAVLTMIVLTFVGATAVALSDGHITVDLITSRLRGVRRHRVEFAGHIISIVTLLFVMAAGLDHVFSDLRTGRQYMGNFLALPRAWVIALVPLGLAMLSGAFAARATWLWRRGFLRRTD